MPVLDGVIVALLTPVTQEGRVDHGALGRLVERLVDRGVTGVSPLGSTGEGYSLGLEQRLAVVDTVARSVPAGMPVVPGVFAHNHEQAVAEIAAYADRGGTAVLVAPPSYYPLQAAEQEGYFSRLADAAALPLVLYNIPVYTKVQIVPEVVLACYEAVRAGKLDDALRLEARLRAVQAAFGTGSPPAAYKAALAAAGVGEPWLVPPRLPLTKAETAQLLTRLTALEVL